LACWSKKPKGYKIKKAANSRFFYDSPGRLLTVWFLTRQQNSL